MFFVGEQLDEVKNDTRLPLRRVVKSSRPFQGACVQL